MMTHSASSQRCSSRFLFPTRILPIVAASLFLAGCVSYSNPEKGYGVGDRSARQDLATVRVLLESDRYYEALPRLQQVIAKYPHGNANIDARYLLGYTYYKIDDYRDAIESLHEYLALAPEGKYGADARALVARLEKEYGDRYPDHQDIEREIATAQQDLQKHAGSLELSTRLADLLWRHGDYAKAGALYTETARKFPELKRDPVFSERIEIGPGENYTVLTPAEILRREIDRRPLSVLNTASFRTGRDLITRQPLYYSVTGQVLNRSDSVLYGVEVHVTIYGYGTTIYDTATYRLGRLNPAESRAFRTRFSNFESINRIDRYECTVSYQR